MATLGKEGSGHCKEGAIVERFKHEESMHELSAKKSGRCREMVISGDSTVYKKVASK